MVSDPILTNLDVLKLALANELRGASFYSAMARRSENPETKVLFQRLAEEEREHFQLFEKLLASADKEPLGSPLAKNMASYLQTLMENSVFPADTEQLAARITPKEALGMGIQAEKDSILLYHELYTAIQDSDNKEMLSKLLQEEKMHLVELRAQYEEK